MTNNLEWMTLSLELLKALWPKNGRSFIKLLNYLPREMAECHSLKFLNVGWKKIRMLPMGTLLYFWRRPGDYWVMFFFYSIFDYCSWLPYTDTFFFLQVGILFKLKKSQLLGKQLGNVSHLPSLLSAFLAEIGYLAFFFHFSLLRSSSRDAI